MPTLVPSPQSLTPASGPPLRLGRQVRVSAPAELPALRPVVAGLLDRLHGLEDPPGSEPVPELRLVLGRPDLGALRPAAGLSPHTGLEEGEQEAFELVVTEQGATVTAPAAEGLFRGATAFAQLIGPGGEVPAVRVLDGPGLRWRGLSLDVVRRFFPVEQVKRVLDLLALYRFNVLHLHLTDSQAWRLEIDGRPRLTAPENAAESSRNGEGRQYYTQDDYRELVAYAAERFVTVVPEIDVPGHTQAAVRAYPELRGPDEPPHELISYLDPRNEHARRFTAEVFAQVAALTPGPFVHLGGDEAFGMPAGLYARFVTETLAIVRATGKRVAAWQEAARSGALEPGDVAQSWIGLGDEFDPERVKASVPAEYHPLVDVAAESFEHAAADTPKAVEAGAWVLASPSSVLYLDRRYAEESADPAQTPRREQVGMPAYTPKSCRELYGWQPRELPEIPAGARLAGVEAAIWCESVTGFEDLAFLLLPRLPGIAEKAWSPRPASWAEHRDRLRAHAPWWERLGWGGYWRSADVFG
ncbi:family 20 glycosylhydrolase [Nonomuraea sp. NPDC050310]|uniref:family 20 glycosylhydrolase n=1 Tax=Nonomuraea sp. NPDC050310 TaxID=3154935 RepID=UPI0033D8EAD9